MGPVLLLSHSSSDENVIHKDVNVLELLFSSAWDADLGAKVIQIKGAREEVEDDDLSQTDRSPFSPHLPPPFLFLSLLASTLSGSIIF